jgi:hypothetical protein
MRREMTRRRKRRETMRRRKRRVTIVSNGTCCRMMPQIYTCYS